MQKAAFFQHNPPIIRYFDSVDVGNNMTNTRLRKDSKVRMILPLLRYFWSVRDITTNGAKKPIIKQTV